tara:strand:+ start:181 stop:705 length:525 start_codon:yes stop_codon:yes gene_type:complete
MMTDAKRFMLDSDNKPMYDTNGMIRTTQCEERHDANGLVLQVVGLPGSPEHTASLLTWRSGTVSYTQNIQLEFEINPDVVALLQDAKTLGQTQDEMEIPPVLPAKHILKFAKTSLENHGADKFNFKNVDGKPVTYNLASCNKSISQRKDGDDTVLIISAVYKPEYVRKNMRTAW